MMSLTRQQSRQVGTLGEDAVEDRSGRLPSFVIIGAMKAGSTSLYSYLGRHPGIFMCPSKEPQFFSRDHVYARGIGWYASLFANCRRDQICGEASTCYSRQLEYPLASKRMHEHIPGAKLIYIMRHPVERAYSHYAHIMAERWVRYGELALKLEESLERYPTILDASHYIRQIAAYRQWWSAGDILLLTLDELRDNSVATLARVQQFLGVETVDLVGAGTLKEDPAGDLLRRKRAWTAFTRLRGLPGVRKTARLMPRQIRQTAKRALVEFLCSTRWSNEAAAKYKAVLPPLTPDQRHRLLGEFEGSTREVESLLGGDLSAWLK